MRCLIKPEQAARRTCSLQSGGKSVTYYCNNLVAATSTPGMDLPHEGGRYKR